MATATGKRLLAACCFLLGGLTIIGIPIFWPLGYLLWKGAAEQEAERERELDALDSQAPDGMDARERLRTRFADGEIDEAEYERRLDVLEKES